MRLLEVFLHGMDASGTARVLIAPASRDDLLPPSFAYLGCGSRKIGVFRVYKKF
tara:strand:+ start:74 stop:235 length:162 start_codon:yes stop_codon:yes gene_type:complete